MGGQMNGFRKVDTRIFLIYEKRKIIKDILF